MSKYLISVLDIREYSYMFLTIFDNTVVESDNKVDNYKKTSNGWSLCIQTTT